MEDQHCNLDKFNDGVISFEEETYKVERFINSSKDYFLQYSQIGSSLISHMRSQAQLKINLSQKDYANWFNGQGIPCSILSPDTNGWQAGKVKIKIHMIVEFHPDDPESLLIGHKSDRETPQESESPLDDIRSLEEQE